MKERRSRGNAKPHQDTVKLSVSYIKIPDGKGTVRKLRDLKHVLHAIVVPVRKGVWYFHVSFDVRTEHSFSGCDTPHTQDRYFPVSSEERGHYAVIKFDWTEAGGDMDIFGTMSKASYHGIMIRPDMISKAWDKYAGGSE